MMGPLGFLGSAVPPVFTAWMISRSPQARNAARKCKGSQLTTNSQSEPPNRPLSIHPNHHRTATSEAMAPMITTAFHAPAWSRNFWEMDASTWMKVKKPMKPKK